MEVLVGSRQTFASGLMIELRVEERVRIVTFIGELTVEDLRYYEDGAHSHPDFDPSHDSLVDLREVTSFNLNSTEVGEVENRARRIFAKNPRRIAFVVASQLAYGFARAFEIQHSDTPDKVKIFSSMEEARSWLGLPTGAPPFAI